MEDTDAQSAGETTSSTSAEVNAQGESYANEVERLKAEISNLEMMVEQLEIVNSEQKAQIDRLQKDRIRKSVVLQPSALASIKEEEETEEVPEDGTEKLNQFFKMFQMNNVSDAQLSIHGVNSLISVYQVMYAKEREEDAAGKSETSQAARVAFNYVLEMMRQLNERKLNTDTASVDFGYPINWLLSLFPYMASEEESKHPEKVTDSLWMPLHFALAIDTSGPGFDSDKYLAHLELLLTEYGDAAFEEDVSPLSIAVSTARPNLDAVRLILEFRPDSVRKTDEDGSLPFMHACANNEGTEVVAFLHELYPGAMHATDSFGCAAIHYAAFYGTPEVVEYLVQLDPACASMVEGNGALPLHDAVQNKRTFGRTEMVEILLKANPSAVRKRDDYGAFPLHKAAKSATLNVVQLIQRAFPKAVFGPDIEDLLPMHYVAERHDKDQHLDLLQFIVAANPQSKALDDAALFAADPDPSSTAAQGGWRGAMRSMWGGSAAKAPAGGTTPVAAAGAASVPSAPAAKAGTPSSPGASGRAASATHNKRKSVRPVRGSIHEQYRR